MRVQSTILPVPYYHVILTVPQEITQLAFAHPRVLYPLVLRVGAAALLSCAGELFAAQLAVLVVLHTWGQLLNCHLHGHFLLPAGGLSLDGQCWIALSREEFQQLVKMLETVFRDLFLKQLRKVYDRGELTFSGDAPWRGLQRPEAFGQWLEPLSRIPWVVHVPGCGIVAHCRTIPTA